MTLRYLTPACALLFGYATLAYLILALAALGCATPIPLLIALVVSLVVGPLAARHILPPEHDAAASRYRGLVALSVAVAAPFAVFWQLPPHMEDDLLYHLTIPRHIARTGALSTDPFSFHLPYTFELPLTLVEAFGPGLGGLSPFIVNTVMLAVLVLTMIGLLTKRYGLGLISALGVVLAMVTMPAVVEITRTAYVEIFFALLLMTALALFCGHEERGEPGTASPLWYGACALGGIAAGSKYYGLLLPAALIVAERLRSPRITRHLVLGALLAALIAAPWYVKNFVLVGNPVYPFLAFLFPSEHLSIERLILMARTSELYGGGRTVIDFLLLPVRIISAEWGTGEGGRLAGYLSAIVGLACVAVFDSRLTSRLATFIALVFFGIWAASIHIVRYLFPFLLPACLIGAAVLVRRGPIAKGALLLLCIASLAQNTVHATRTFSDETLRDRLLGRIDDATFLGRRLPGTYGMAMAANRLVDAQTDRLMLIGIHGRGYYFDAPAFGIHFYDTEPFVVGLGGDHPEPARVGDFFADHRVTHLVIDWRFVEALHPSTNSDGRFTAAHMRRYLAEHAESLYAEPPFELVRLRADSR